MKLLKILSALFAGIFSLYIGNGLFLSSAGIKLSESGISNTLIGAVNTSFFVGAALSAIAAHLVVSRVGHARSFAVFAALISVGTLLHTLSDNVWFWMLLRVMQGFCHYGLLVVAESWLNEKSDSSIRGRVMGVYQTIFYIAFACGVILMGLNLSNTGIFILSALFTILALVPVALTKLPEPAIPPRERASIPKLLTIAPLALVGGFVGGITVTGFFTMSSVFMLNQGFSVQEASYFMTAALIGGFVIQIPVGRLSDRYGRRNTLIVMSSLSLIASTATWLVHGTAHLQYIIGFFLGCGIFTIYSLSLARANDVVNDKATSLIEISRTLLFAYGVGSLISPMLLGVVMQYFGAYGFGAVLSISSALLLAVSIWQDRAQPQDRSTYISMPAGLTDMASVLDPRVDEVQISDIISDEVEFQHPELFAEDNPDLFASTNEAELLDEEENTAGNKEW